MLPNYVEYFYDSREDRCWSDESLLQCGSTGGGQCIEGSNNRLDWDVVDESASELTPAPGKAPSGSCKMKPLGAFDYWRIAPPFGNWGRALPRTGHVIHSNKIAAAGLAALRAFNVARYPVEVWPQEGFLRLPLSNPDVGGPAPIGQPAIFPWVGPFPCTHLLNNSLTGLQGTQAFPAGVDLASVFGGNYCQGGDADDSNLDAEGNEEDGSCLGNWKNFQQMNHDQAKERRKEMIDNDRTPQEAMALYPPRKEMLRWIYWRHRKCT